MMADAFHFLRLFDHHIVVEHSDDEHDAPGYNNDPLLLVATCSACLEWEHYNSNRQPTVEARAGAGEYDPTAST